MKYLIFKVAENQYAIDIRNIKSIEKNMDIVSMPTQSSNIAGLINIRNEIYPVYDLAKRMGQKEETENSKERQLLVIEKDDIKMVILAKDANQMVDITREERFPLPDLIKYDHPYFHKVGKHENQLCFILSVEKLLTEEEKKIAEHMIEEQEA